MRVMIVFLYLFCALSVAVAADDGVNKQFEVVALSPDQTIVVDGLLNDDFWQSQNKITDFHQVKPKAFSKASEQTEVMVGFDSQYFLCRRQAI